MFTHPPTQHPRPASSPTIDSLIDDTSFAELNKQILLSKLWHFYLTSICCSAVCVALLFSAVLVCACQLLWTFVFCQWFTGKNMSWQTPSPLLCACKFYSFHQLSVTTLWQHNETEKEHAALHFGFGWREKSSFWWCTGGTHRSQNWQNI